VDLRTLNRLSIAKARETFLACCAATEWADTMTQRRPFHDLTALLAAAEEVWWDLTPEDWLEAFATHPRIGERSNTDDMHSEWSSEEQAGVSDDDETRRLLADANRAYEDQFGFTYIVFATGRTAEEMLDLCRQRLEHDELHEYTVAAAEQARITNLRLRKLVAGSE